MDVIEDKEFASRCRFVGPDTTKLPLSGGHWIEVKVKLSVGDKKKIESAGVKRVNGLKGVTVELDHDEYSFVRAETYITDWSLTNKDNKNVAVSGVAIRMLDEETFEEIENAITKHVVEQEAIKKARAGGSKPTAT